MFSASWLEGGKVRASGGCITLSVNYASCHTVKEWEKMRALSTALYDIAKYCFHAHRPHTPKLGGLHSDF